MASKRSRGVGVTKPDGTSDDTRVEASKPAENDGQRSLYVQIADRAYYIWLERGKPDHGAWDYWFQAEAEIIREHVDRRARRET